MGEARFKAIFRSIENLRPMLHRFLVKVKVARLKVGFVTVTFNKDRFIFFFIFEISKYFSFKEKDHKKRDCISRRYTKNYQVSNCYNFYDLSSEMLRTIFIFDLDEKFVSTLD